MLKVFEDRNKPWKDMPRPNPRYICCPSCGESTGLPPAFHMVIPPEGLKCRKCGMVVIQGNNLIF